jgi:hypothetical protein
MPNRPHLREALIALAALSLGWWAHTSPVRVHAAEPTDLRFELSGFGPTTALSVYNPTDHTIYVYQNAIAGNSRVQCTYSFHLGRLGGPIDRQNCPIGSLLP